MTDWADWAWLGGFIFIIILLILFYLLKSHAQPVSQNPFDGTHELPYTRRPIMTPTELHVYDKLLRALPDFMVFAQVQVSRVVESPEEDNFYWFNFVNRLSYDFVICRQDGTPIVAIEIDDDTHELEERKQVDTRKDLATEAAQIVMIRWNVREIPTIREIAYLIQEIHRQQD